MMVANRWIPMDVMDVLLVLWLILAAMAVALIVWLRRSRRFHALRHSSQKKGWKGADSAAVVEHWFRSQELHWLARKQ